MGIIENVESLLARGQDNALLRYSLGHEYAKIADWASSRPHLEQALRLDPRYSAAWKLLGKVQQELGDLEGALAAYDSGIAAARDRGDIQAAKEMEVFRKRVVKRLMEGQT